MLRGSSFHLTLILLSCWTVFPLQFTFLDFLTDFGAIPFDSSPEACQLNTALLSEALQKNGTNQTLRIPPNHTFYLHRGVYAKDLNNSILMIDGELRFERPPELDHGKFRPKPCFQIDRGSNITLTSSNVGSRGVINGQGSQYWGIPLIGYLQLGENRPRLMQFSMTSHLLIENIILQDSPYHTLYLASVNHVEIRNMSVVARRTNGEGHNLLDLSAFNTDGIDVSGSNVWIHDVDIWTQDDSIAVKDNYDDASHLSSNMTFERINASGLGLTIGSIGGGTVRNVTFKDSYLHRTVKGIYLKFRKPDKYWLEQNLTGGLVEDILFDNIVMEEPEQWPIWIGPAQQADASNPCHANPCSLCWPIDPDAECSAVPDSRYRHLTLSNVQINNPKMSPGVILGSHRDYVDGLLFHNVRVTRGLAVHYATADLTETFPGLRQPIDDRFVPAAVQSLAASGKDRGVNDGDVNVWANFGVSQFSNFSPVLSLVGLAAWASLMVSPKWQRWNQYYRCEGVVNGYASGDTWPIPDCFKRVGTSQSVTVESAASSWKVAQKGAGRLP